MGSDTEQPGVNVELRLPILIDNKIIKRDTRKKDEEERRRNPRLIVKCVCGHPKCIKRRDLRPKFTELLGQGQPVAFLVAWARAGPRCKTKAGHMQRTPHIDDVRREFRMLRSRGLV